MRSEVKFEVWPNQNCVNMGRTNSLKRVNSLHLWCLAPWSFSSSMIGLMTTCIMSYFHIFWQQTKLLPFNKMQSHIHRQINKSRCNKHCVMDCFGTIVRNKTFIYDVLSIASISLFMRKKWSRLYFLEQNGTRYFLSIYIIQLKWDNHAWNGVISW